MWGRLSSCSHRRATSAGGSRGRPRPSRPHRLWAHRPGRAPAGGREGRRGRAGGGLRPQRGGGRLGRAPLRRRRRLHRPAVGLGRRVGRGGDRHRSRPVPPRAGVGGARRRPACAGREAPDRDRARGRGPGRAGGPDRADAAGGGDEAPRRGGAVRPPVHRRAARPGPLVQRLVPLGDLRPGIEAALFPPVVAEPAARQREAGFKADRRRYLLATHGAHVFDTVRFLLGEVASVAARHRQDGPDHVWQALLTTTSGAVGTVTIAADVPGLPSEGIEVFGAAGAVRAELHFPFHRRAATVHAYRDGAVVRPTLTDGDAYQRQVEAFAHTFPRDTPEEVAAAVARAGYPLGHWNFAAVGRSTLAGDVDQAEVAAVRRAFDRAGVAIPSVSATFNVIHPDPARRATQTAQAARLIGLVPELGAEVVTLCLTPRP